jgi:hypothetical protein
MKVIDAGQKLQSAGWGRYGLARLLHFSAARQAPHRLTTCAHGPLVNGGPMWTRLRRGGFY